MDVVSNHQFALVRQEGKWEVVQGSERRQAEDRIQKQNEFLEDVLESLPYPFYVVDASDYTIKMVNSAAVKERITPGITTCYAFTHRRSEPCGNE